MLPNLASLTLGADPEGFLAFNGKIIGAEKVIGANGLIGTNPCDIGVWDHNHPYSKTVLDGVQFEIHPAPSYCRAALCNALASAFRALRDELKKHEGVGVSFSTVVEVDRAELDSLSDKSRILGCAASKNYHNASATPGVDGATYMKRSAGGHVHFSKLPIIDNHYGWEPRGDIDLSADPSAAVPVCDILMGLPSVLIEKDQANVRERRKVYGRAGEFRLPKYGLEYRTLSNFWLRSAPLASLVFALARLSIAAASSKAAVNQLGECVKLAEVVEAINGADVDLARKLWSQLTPWFDQWRPGMLVKTPYASNQDGLASGTLAAFDYFVSKPIEYWFPEDPLEHWCSVDQINSDPAIVEAHIKTGKKGLIADFSKEAHSKGWESFLLDRVIPEMNKEVRNGSYQSS